jgi:hypothetical protein
MRGVLFSRSIWVAVGSLFVGLFATATFSKTAHAQAGACFVWIDAATGKRLASTPVGTPSVERGATGGANLFGQAHLTNGVDAFRDADGNWINSATGELLPTTPVGTPSVEQGATGGANLFGRAHLTNGVDAVRVPCAPPATQAAWTGPFGGAQAVGSWSHVSTNEFLAATGVQTNHFDNSGNGFGGGINGGFNWMPWGGNIVTGVVLDANGMSDKVNHTFPGGTFIGSTVNFEGSADVRAGLLVTPSTLLYGQTGVSVADQRLQINFGGPITDTTQWTAGYNLGGGAEWMLPANVSLWGHSTSLFINYEHTWWDKASLTMPAASPFFNYTWMRQSDAVEVGFRVQFGVPETLASTVPAVYSPVGSSHYQTTDRKRAAKKPVRGKEGDKASGNAGQKPPDAIPTDPATGIPVDGGFVHRGTGTTRGRNGIFCWVTKDKGNTDQDKCTEYKEYQSVTVNTKAKWGDGPEQDVNAALNAKHKSGIRTATGTILHLGELDPDGHAALGGVDSVDLPNPNGNPVSTPPYRKDKIPGTGGEQGLIDAPQWGPTGDALGRQAMPKDVADKPTTSGHKQQPSQPPNEVLGTFKVLEHFRTYVYCTKPQRKCLGYFEWDYEETFTFSLHWVQTEASLSAALGMNSGPVGGQRKSDAALQKEEDERVKTWRAEITSSDTPDGPKNISGWKTDCN